LSTQEEKLKAIADAIREKDGTTDPIPANSFPERIRAISGGTATAPPKEVNFYDYDGTLVYSYTLSEARELTALPEGPVHDGLVFQGWNWTLENIQTLTRPMNVGAMYITDDGRTRLRIRVWDRARSDVPLCISQTISNGVTIDWGDGSEPETLEGTGYVNTSHRYVETGDYTISLAAADGCELGFGDGTASECILGNADETMPTYCNLLREVNIGSAVTTIDNYAFRNCKSLACITIPNGVVNIKSSVFYNCYFLAGAVIPDSVKSLSYYLFNGCYSLTSVSTPNEAFNIGSATYQQCRSLVSTNIQDGAASIDGSGFSNCYSLTSIVIPDSVTRIGANAFGGCSGMAEYHLKPTVPPALADANAFSGIPSDCVIYVPAGSLEAYRTAENWSVYADRMREEG